MSSSSNPGGAISGYDVHLPACPSAKRSQARRACPVLQSSNAWPRIKDALESKSSARGRRRVCDGAARRSGNIAA